jgi:hypothetical protein
LARRQARVIIDASGGGLDQDSVTSTTVLITNGTSFDRLNSTPRRSGRHNAEVGGSSSTAAHSAFTARTRTPPADQKPDPDHDAPHQKEKEREEGK